MIADNVRRLLDLHYPRVGEIKTPSEQGQALNKDAGVSWSTVQRLLNPECGKQIDIIVDVAVALRCQPEQLLIDGFALGEIEKHKGALANANQVVLQRTRGS